MSGQASLGNAHPLAGMLEFIAVVEGATFTGAARNLGVSISHISRQVAALESRLATQLFVRTTRRMQLTEAGRRLFDGSQPLMQELMRAQESVVSEQDAIEGVIRISLAGKFAEDRLVPLLVDFCSEHPKVVLQLDISARNVDLIGEGVHLAVRMGPLDSSASLAATRLLSVPMLVLASPALLEEVGSISSPAKLPVERCLPLVGRPWSFKKGKIRESIEPAGRYATNSGSAITQAAIAGLGIVNVPAYYADVVVRDGALVRLLEDWTSVEETTFHLVFPSARHLPVRVRRLIDYLQERVSEGA